MGRKVSFDLDVLLGKAKLLSGELPGLLQAVQGLGYTGLANGIARYSPLLGPCMGLIDKLAGDSDGMSGSQLEGLPDTGPKGRGRLTYLRKKSQWTNEQVVAACNTVLGLGFSQSLGIENTLNYTLACMFPDGKVGNEWSDSQCRAAVDQVLEMDGLTEGTCDKFGDWIWYALNHPPPLPEKPKEAVASTPTTNPVQVPSPEPTQPPSDETDDEEDKEK
jgi:hypothetical protein